VKNKKNLIAAVVLTVIFGTWFMHYYSDKEVIKRKFVSIAIDLTLEGEETPVVLALKMRPVKEFISQQCEVSIPERDYLEVLEPDLAIRYIIMYRTRHTNLLINYDEMNVDIPTKNQASVNLLVRVAANRDHQNYFEETHQVECYLEKINKTWFLKKATLPEALMQ